MKITQSTLDEVLEVYTPGWKYLTAAELEYPRAKGAFQIGQSAYVNDTGHANVAELVVCYSQLGYAALLEAEKNDLLPWPQEPAFQFREIWRKLMIAKMEHTRFRRQIDPKHFDGLFSVKDIVARNGSCFFQTTYDFAEGSATGEILLALPHRRH